MGKKKGEKVEVKAMFNIFFFGFFTKMQVMVLCKRGKKSF